MPKTGKIPARASVLIIEDSVDFSNLLKFVVEDEGLDGIQFPVTQDDVVSWAKKHKPVLVLTDLALRKKDGFHYINDLRGDPSTRKIPIAIVSGRDLAHKEILELQVQGIKYFRKGRVEMSEIRDEIRAAVRNKSISSERATNED